MKYRAEVDGLRTLAIVPVLLYHAGLQLGDWRVLPGGFLGVDVFFVISGYLITRLILEERQASGKFNFLGFYERRARRLLPVLLLVMLACIPLAWYWLLPEQLMDFARSMLASLGFVSNVYWQITLQAYEAESALLRPLLHTWSLAVEEQYYLLMPLLLLWLRPTRLGWTLGCLLLVSLFAAHGLSGQQQALAFYLLPTRIWEMLAGSLLAWLALRRSSELTLGRLGSALALCGLIAIGLSMLLLDFSARHPGLVTLVPVVGCMLVIQFANATSAPGRWLSWPPMVWVGLLSYSLYIWHYPIFAFGRIVREQPQLTDKLVWLILTLGLSVIGYWLVEKPCRNRQLLSSRQFILLSASGIATVLVASLWLMSNEGHAARFGYVGQVLAQAKRVWLKQDGRICHSGGMGRKEFPLDQSCEFIDFPGGRYLVLIGDSHAATIQNDLRSYAREQGLNYTQFTNAWCNHIEGLSSQDALCLQRSTQVLTRLEELDKPLVVYASRIPYRVEMERFSSQSGAQEAGYRPRPTDWALQQPQIMHKITEGLERIAQRAGQLVLVYPVPEQGFNVRDKLAPRQHLYRKAADLPVLTTNYAEFKQRTTKSYQALDAVQGANVLRVYPEQVFCQAQNGLCVVAEREQIYYDSDNHLSPLGARMLMENVIETVAGSRLRENTKTGSHAR